VALGAALLGLAILFTHSGCVCGPSRLPPEAGRDFGHLEAPIPDATALLAMAHAAAAATHPPHPAPPSSASPPSPLSALPSRRVVLALWRGGEALVATANGSTLADSVAIASASLRDRVTKGAGASGIAGPAAEDGAGAFEGRLELDLPTSLDAATIGEDMEVPVASIGLEGVLVTRDDGKTGVVLPGEVVQRGMFHGKALDGAAIANLLAARAGVSERDLESMRAYRFRADTHIESAAQVGTPLAALRGMVQPPADITPEALLSAVRRGADYLIRVLGPSGRYVYMYHPVVDRDDPSYGWLRHSGTTYALLEAYGEFREPSYLAKGELALSYLAAHLSADAPSQGKYVLDTDDEEQQKVGGAGLALLAFAEHAAVTGDRQVGAGGAGEGGKAAAYLEVMRALARFILKQQYEDGHFRSNADIEHETGKKLKRELWYYPGEAVLGLLRLYAIDPQPVYLDGARRGADWIVKVRDAYVSEDNQEHDHWMSYAFSELYRLTRDEAYLDHAYKIARAIEKAQRPAEGAPAPDFIGTFYDGQTTPASTRLEAYCADIALSRFAGKPDAWLIGPAKAAARSTLGQQYGPDNDYWLKNPGKAAGGVRESLFVHDVRIDYVQHAMSGWLHLARILRDNPPAP
jgi:hypothetical protein